jgi:two-component system, sensor histidine kinase and response regulator
VFLGGRTDATFGPMKLRSVTRGMLAAVLLALVVNAAVLVAIRRADTAVQAAYLQRDQTQRFVEQLLQENDLLAYLAQSYTTTAETRYLGIYYDMLAVREGQRPAPQVEDLALYWRDVVAGRRVHRLPDAGPARSVIDARAPRRASWPPWRR